MSWEDKLRGMERDVVLGVDSAIIMKDYYEIVWGEAVWTEFVKDPDTGETIQVLIEPENWTEI